MISMIRSELYRFLKTRGLWFMTGAFCLVALATPFALWLYTVWPAFAATGFVDIPDQPISSLRLYGVAFVADSLLSMYLAIFVSYLVSQDFKSGYIKNLIQAHGGRVAYVVAIMVACLVLAAAYTLLVMLRVEASLRMQGYVPAAVGPLEAFRWYAQVVFCIAAYAAIVALLVMLTGSDTVGVMGAILVAGGAVEYFLMFVLANIPGLPAAVRDCLDAYLSADLTVLTGGVVTDPLTYAQAGITFLVAAVLCVLVMRRKSLD